MTQLVRDLMHRGLITCRQDATIGQVAVLLTQHHVHALAVVDRDNRPMGLISDFDLLAGEWLSADTESLATMRKLCAGDLMSYPIISVEADALLSEAAKLLIEKDVNRLLVTDKGKAIGMLSGSDFVASISRTRQLERNKVSDVMSDAILVCRDKTSLGQVARAMTDAHYRSVLVVDPRGKPVGVVSERDVIPLIQNGGIPEELTVQSVMHTVLTVDLHATLREAADLMIKNHHHRVVVVDSADPDAFPLGIISSFDIVAEMAKPGSEWQS
ncbi:MAG TPA: CBS domain-containing protein [Anaerolineales bacterium]|nr:CBS domain-containing protein [Anaerolineales bacterium]